MANTYHNASYMSSMTDVGQTYRVIIRLLRVPVDVDVPDKIIASGDLEAGSEAATQRRVLVPDAGVDHANLGALAEHTCLVELVNAGGAMGAVLGGPDVVAERLTVHRLFQLHSTVWPDIGDV